MLFESFDGFSGFVVFMRKLNSRLMTKGCSFYEISVKPSRYSIVSKICIYYILLIYYIVSEYYENNEIYYFYTAVFRNNVQF